MVGVLCWQMYKMCGAGVVFGYQNITIYYSTSIDDGNLFKVGAGVHYGMVW
jgi:hypothetical protein